MQTGHTIYIIGAGAIGKALAVFLHNEGRKVQLIRGRVSDDSESTETMHVETSAGNRYEASLTIKTLHAFDSLDGIVVVAIKSYGNEQLAATLKNKIGNSPVVLLQNGLGVEQPFIDYQFSSIYRCVLFVSSQETEKNSIRFKPADTCRVGIEAGNAKQLREIVQQLHTGHFLFSAEEQIQPIIWKKAICNSVFNSVCPLLDIDNGIFHRNKTALKIAKDIIAECLVIAAAKGISLDADSVEQTLLKISRSSDGQMISTLVDIQKGQKTEIDTLNIEIARLAYLLNKEAQVTRTSLLGELTRLKAELCEQVA